MVKITTEDTRSGDVVARQQDTSFSRVPVLNRFYILVGMFLPISNSRKTEDLEKSLERKYFICTNA